jgi:dihydroflavonol-4-reductase
MTVVVTGASGHIGANLVRTLVGEGRRVRVLVRRQERALDGVECERVTGDVLDPSSVDRLVRGADVVYHLAAKISLADRDDECGRINVEGVRNVTEASLRHGVRRLIHFSSIHALSPEPTGGIVDEKRALNVEGDLVPVYDRSKAAGQRIVLCAVTRGLDAVILHPAGVLGPYDFTPSRMGRVLLALAHGRMPGLVEGGFSWVDVRDVVSAALAAEKKGRPGEAYLLSGHWRSVHEIAALAAEVTGRPPPVLSSPMWLARAVAPLATWGAELLRVEPLFTRASLHALRNHRLTSHEKAKRELDFDPRPTRDTIADTYAWFREMGMLRR